MDIALIKFSVFKVIRMAEWGGKQIESKSFGMLEPPIERVFLTFARYSSKELAGNCYSEVSQI